LSGSDASGAQTTPLVVKELAGFQLVGELGQGGMGKVFLARQRSLDRLVALKVLQPDLANDAEFLKRFSREAQSAALFQHPNVVAVIDAGRDPASGVHYIAFEYIEGGTLEDRLKKGPLPEREVIEVLRGVAMGLAFAESKGIVHRDVKPENILITPDGEPKLADLGLAKPVGPDGANKSVTQTGVVLGTPIYMAPEQALGERDLDVRADIYSLGLVLWRCLTGTIPFDEDGKASSLQILSRKINQDLPDLRKHMPSGVSVSAGTARVCAWMTARERDDRYRSAGSLVEDLSLLLTRGEPLGPRPQGPDQPTQALDSRALRAAVRSTSSRRAKSVAPTRPSPDFQPVQESTKPSLAGLALVVLLLAAALGGGLSLLASRGGAEGPAQADASGVIDGADPGDDDLPEGDLPDGDLPEGDLPEDDVWEGDVGEGDLPEGDLPDGDLPEGDLPHDAIPYDDGTYDLDPPPEDTPADGSSNGGTPAHGSPDPAPGGASVEAHVRALAALVEALVRDLPQAEQARDRLQALLRQPPSGGWEPDDRLAIERLDALVDAVARTLEQELAPARVMDAERTRDLLSSAANDERLRGRLGEHVRRVASALADQFDLSLATREALIDPSARTGYLSRVGGNEGLSVEGQRMLCSLVAVAHLLDVWPERPRRDPLQALSAEVQSTVPALIETTLLGCLIRDELEQLTWLLGSLGESGISVPLALLLAAEDSPDAEWLQGRVSLAETESAVRELELQPARAILLAVPAGAEPLELEVRAGTDRVRFQLRGDQLSVERGRADRWTQVATVRLEWFEERLVLLELAPSRSGQHEGPALRMRLVGPARTGSRRVREVELPSGLGFGGKTFTCRMLELPAGLEAALVHGFPALGLRTLLELMGEAARRGRTDLPRRPGRGGTGRDRQD
jgi:serine/threonine protein kinase